MRTAMQEPDEREVPPTFWRGERGPVERSQEQWQDANGGIGSPWIGLTVLKVMENNKSISREMAHAGKLFHDDFIVAGHETLRAADMGRMPGGAASSLSVVRCEAKNRAWKAIKALGGLGSPLGECAWHVLGLEETLKEWAKREGWVGRPIGEKTAAGILIGALGVLKDHYG